TSAPNPPIPVPVQESTSTVAQERVLLYFATESNLVEVRVQLPVPVTLARLLEALTVRPELAGSPNLRTVLGPEDVQSVTTLGGVATVDLGSRFSELPVAEQRLAVAQMVLTLTSQAGVGQVRFTVAGQEADVPRADGSIARSAVSRDDYATLLR
ncbi:MAG: GerMN domain-containing protein, partial [Acidimicrobiia bacterium]|nr:GerMN domain-containing protein [Acidimicrobiia bacterium]